MLGGRALGLGFSRPQVGMSLVNEHDLKPSPGERNSSAVTGAVMSECSFTVDAAGCCKAEFHSLHVDQLKPANGRNAALQKYAFVFRTTVSICGCQIPLEVSQVLLFRIFITRQCGMVMGLVVSVCVPVFLFVVVCLYQCN